MDSAICSTPTLLPSAVVDVADDFCRVMPRESWESAAAADDGSAKSASAESSSLPKLESLRDLERRCEYGPEPELWRALAIAAAVQMTQALALSPAVFEPPGNPWREALYWLSRYRRQQRERYESPPCSLQEAQELADLEIADELNLFFDHLLTTEEDDMPATAKRKPKQTEEERKQSGKREMEIIGFKLSGEPVPADYQAKLQAGPHAPASVAPLHRAAMREGFGDAPIEVIIPTHNPRTHFDQDKLQELAESIRRHGVLQPLLVRPPGLDGRCELVAGERRLRAAKLVGLSTVPVMVVEKTDLETAAARLEENLSRDDLTAVDEAMGYQDLLDRFPGLKQKDLAQQVGRSESHISNRLRLLKLPPVWLKRLQAGEITDHHAWSLVPYSDKPAVVEMVEREWKRNCEGVPTVGEFADVVDRCVQRCSRPLKTGYYYNDGNRIWREISIDPKGKEAEKLDLFTHDGEKRAWNIQLWGTVAAEQERRRSDRESRKTEAEKARQKDDPAAQKKAAQKQAGIYAKKLWRYYVGWHQAALLERLKTDRPNLQMLTLWLLNLGARSAGASGTHWRKALEVERFAEIVADAVAAALSSNFEGYHTSLPPDRLLAFADQAGIDIAQDWTVSEEFLGLHTREQLQELAAEWKVNYANCSSPKRQDVITWLLACKSVKCPKRLIKPKPVSLY